MEPTRLRTPRFRIPRFPAPPFQILIASFVLLAFVLALSVSANQIASAHKFPALNESLNYSREYSLRIDPSAPSAPAPDRTEPQRLSEKDRREVFEKIWREIRDHYYDASFNGVNWDDVHLRYLPLVEATRTDAEFYLLMSQMTGELHDAHTRFNSPEHWRSYKKQQGTTVGFSVDGIDGKTVVTEVEPESNAAHAGVEIGMFVVSVDGEPVASRLEHIEKVGLPSSTERATRWFVYSRLFGGSANTDVKVGLQRPDGTTFEATVKRQLYSEAAEVDARLLASGNAYIRFDGFQHPIVKEFKEALEKYHNAPGLIIDLRKNGGGELSVLLPIASYFYNKKTLFAKDTTRSGKPLSEFAGFFKLPLNLYVGNHGSQIYSGPVAILVDSHSASSSEVFAAGMQETHRAKIVGTQSCGCVLGIAKPRFVKGGGVLEMSEVLWFTPNGRKLEGAGIIPDKTVSPTAADFQRKHDVVLAEADKTLVKTVLANARP